MFPKEVLDHFAHPRNVGTLDAPTATARADNPACGDIMELTAIFRDQSIADIAFRAKGCVASMAAGSALTELIKGMDVTRARELKRETLVAELGGLTPESMHASHLAMDALHALLRQLP